MSRVVVVVIAIVAINSVSLAPVHADDQEERNKKSAKEAFKEGVKATKRGDLQAAAEHYKRSIDFRPHPRTYFNLGVVSEKLERWADAVKAFENYLATVEDEDRDQEQMALVRDRIRRLRERAEVVVSIDSVPRNAEVYLDGRNQPLGKTPFKASLVPGEYRLKLTHPDRGDTERTIVVKKRGEEFRLEMHERPATLRIRSNVSDSSVLIDKVQVGPASQEFDVVPGQHTIVVRAAGYEDAAKRLSFETAAIVSMEAKLSRSRTTTQWWVIGGLGIGCVLGAGTAVAVGLKAHQDDDNSQARVADLIGGTSALLGASAVFYYFLTRAQSTVSVQ